jgi:hypothetical protein
MHLTSLKSLKTFHLNETKVTAAGVASLKKALPDCYIPFSAAKPAGTQ